MAVITVRNLDDDAIRRLQARAARNGRSTEAEVRAILVEAVAEQDEPANFLITLPKRFAEIGGVDLELPERDKPVRVVDFGS